jgi:tryptophan-rich sensory protein
VLLFVLAVVLVTNLSQAALLILPYLAWVGFAASLNWKVVDLNPR